MHPFRRTPRLTVPALATLAAAAVIATGVASPQAGAEPAASPVVASAAATLPTQGLRILLTNDDGWNAPGITAVHDALVAAGHEVQMVAPATNQSGVSARVSFGGEVEVLQHGDPSKVSVSTSPATTVHYGMDEYFSAVKPDLVVSGTNVGQNSGFDTNYSGTVGAATVASGVYGVPAIAISTATDYGHDEDGAYAQTADLLVDLIAEGLPVLPRGQFINVNYPVLDAELPAPLGIRYAANSQASLASITFSPDNDGKPNIWDIVPGRSSEAHAPGTDSALLDAGFVTLGVLDADRSVDASEVTAVTDLIAELNGEKPPVKPTPVVPQPRVSALPTKVVKRASYWLPTSNVADGKVLTVTWKQGRRTITRRAVVANDLTRLKAPRKPGAHKVTITLGGKVLTRATVRVR